MRFDWMPDPEVFIDAAQRLDGTTSMGLGVLPPKEFRYMLMAFCGETGNFEFNSMQRGEPGIQECRVLALCFAAAMAKTGDL